jgi:uncharacterized protein RhaS with RHS repeats
MGTRMSGWLAMVVILAGMMAFVSCAHQEKTAPTSQGAEPEVVAVTAVTVTSTVEAVDAGKRTVMLTGPKGTTTYKAGKDVVNFDQIKVGDQVKATVIDELAVYLRKAGTPPSLGEGTVVALAPKGAKPGMFLANTTEIADKITAVDAGNRTVTLQGLSGKPRTFKVGANVNLADVKKGDDVVVRYTEALAVLVETP